MKFDRAALERLHTALMEAMEYTSNILAVLPAGTTVDVTVDRFTDDVVALEMTGTRFPIWSIDDECGLLSVALDEVADCIDDLFPDYGAEYVH